MSSTPDGAAKFWSWFQSNGDRLIGMMYSEENGLREDAFEELREAFEEVQPGGLIVELGSGPDAEVKQFVVSADGDPDRVDLVKEFVADAPELRGWEVVAFRERIDFNNMNISIQGEDIGPEDVWFEVRDGEEGINLTVYVRGMTKANARMRGLGARLLAEHAIGELDAFTLLASREERPLPGDPEKVGLRPFSELVTLFDRIKARKYPPPGELNLEVDQWAVLQGTFGEWPIFGRLNQGLRPIMRHPAYDRLLSVRIKYNEVGANGIPEADDEFNLVNDMGDALAEALEQGQQSLLAIAIIGRGQRELSFYTADAEGALERLEEFTRDVQSHTIESEVRWDSFWGFYYGFISAGEES